MIEIVKIDKKITDEDLEIWRQVFEEAQNDKDFKIFTHDSKET